MKNLECSRCETNYFMDDILLCTTILKDGILETTIYCPECNKPMVFIYNNIKNAKHEKKRRINSRKK